MNKREGVVGFFVHQNKVLLFLIMYEGGLKWTGIGGFIEKNESPLNALIRETKEEINVDIDFNEVEKRIIIEEENVNLHTFLIRTPNVKPQIIDKTLKEFKWFNFNEVPYEKMWKGNKNWLPEVLGD